MLPHNGKVVIIDPTAKKKGLTNKKTQGRSLDLRWQRCQRSKAIIRIANELTQASPKPT